MHGMDEESASPAPGATTEGARDEILEVTDSGGEPLAYYVLGHNSAIGDGEFARTVASRSTYDDEGEILSGIVREWWRPVPCTCGEHGEHYAKAVPKDVGALAVTAWHPEGDEWLRAEPIAPAPDRFREGWVEGAAAVYRYEGRTPARALHVALWLCDVTYGPDLTPPPAPEVKP
jgi:hypothetical protein